MSTTRLAQVPPGSQDLLAADVERRRRVQRAWFDLAEARGYHEVIPPTFEYEEVFTRAGTKLASELIRFVDRDGRLVALRADFTSAIARLAATRLRDAELPLRLSYAGKVYRQRPEGVGHARETFQAGAELLGSAEADADVEVLRLAIEMLRALRIGDFQINLGDIRFVRPLLAGLQPGEADEIAEDILEETAESTVAEADEDALVEWCLCVDRGHALQLQKRPCCGTSLSTRRSLLPEVSNSSDAYLVWNWRFDVQAVGR